jgi:hypothetical protein
MSVLNVDAVVERDPAFLRQRLAHQNSSRARRVPACCMRLTKVFQDRHRMGRPRPSRTLRTSPNVGFRPIADISLIVL